MKRLSLEELWSVARGAAYVTEDENGVFLHRFTPEQEQVYKETSDEFYMKTSASAGIQLVFKTNATRLHIAVHTSPGSKCRGFSMEACIDGKTIVLADTIAAAGGLQGHFSKALLLGSGEKTLRVYLPWAACARIAEFSLNKEAYILPVPAKKRMLCFGDSITHGMLAMHPQNAYMTRLADMLDADARNKGIGGDVFFPALAQCKDETDFCPEYITVAYGTNDWGKKTPAQFRENARAFYSALSVQYPQAKIFAITPIWRANIEEERPFGPFADLEKIIRAQVEDLENVTVISGLELVEHDTAFYDDGLHPNDDGFAQYAKNLYKNMMKKQ